MPNNKEYLKLKKVWYKKLAKSGFEDIEGEVYLKQTTEHLVNQATKGLSVTDISARLEYNSIATSFLNDHEFKTELEKVIWDYHTNGLSIRAIVKCLRDAKAPRPRGKNTVEKTLKTLKQEMLKRYVK